MKVPNKAAIEHLKKRYPDGTRIRLIKMDDPAAVPKGTLGTVYGVDDIGSLLVRWDNGSNLNVVYGEDVVVIVKESEEEEKTMNHLLKEIFNQMETLRMESHALGKQLLRFTDSKEGRMTPKEAYTLIQMISETLAYLKKGCALILTKK